MSGFWDLMQRSVILQAIITLVLISLICYLVIVGREVPDLISSLTLLVVGFYFGSKVENATTRKVVEKFTDGE